MGFLHAGSFSRSAPGASLPLPVLQAVADGVKRLKKEDSDTDETVSFYWWLDLRPIFIRDPNPYGYALKTRSAIGYTSAEFLTFYKSILDYIIQINPFIGKPAGKSGLLFL